jgi:SAM-dependent methyltransferase
MIMEIASHYSGTLHYARSRWPAYLIGFGGGLILAIFTIIISLAQGLYSFTSLALVALIILIYFLAASLWTAHQLYDGESITDALIKLGSIKSEDNLVQIDLGERFQAINLSRRLTTGHVQVIDVYNPQLAPERALARSRERAGKLPRDPRLTRREGNINLLPLPNDSVKVVVVVECIGRFWQRGDQLRLLHEIVRILQPGGSILLAERVRSSTSILALGPAALRLPSASYWDNILADAGFEVRSQEMVKELICCMRAD